MFHVIPTIHRKPNQRPVANHANKLWLLKISSRYACSPVVPRLIEREKVYPHSVSQLNFTFLINAVIKHELGLICVGFGSES